MSGVSDFGKDFGLIHEAVVSARNAGLGRAEWARLAHEKALWHSFSSVLAGEASIIPNPQAKSKRVRWVKPADSELVRYTNRKNLIRVNLDLAPELPFARTKVSENPKGGWVEVELRRGSLYVGGKACILHLEDGQKDGKSMQGYDLSRALSSQATLHPNILDALLANSHLLPDSLKQDENGSTCFIFFWGVEFSSSGGTRYVRYLVWVGDAWQSGFCWLDGRFDGQNPALLRAL